MLRCKTATPCPRPHQAYDLVSFGRGLTGSHYVGAQETLRMLPTLAPRREDGGSLKGSVRGCRDETVCVLNLMVAD